MIHNVYFWLTDEAKASKRDEFETALKELIKIAEIGDAHVGTPGKTEARPVTDHSFDYNLTLTFANQADHDAYQVHPDHDTFVAQCKDFWAKVVVYDTEPL